MEEIQLIEGLLEQSSKAQQEALERFGSIVFAQVARMISPQEDAEEVYQDVFLKVFRNIKMYDTMKSTLKTWIMRIAYNEAISHLRRKRQRMIYLEERESELAHISEAEVEETLGRPNPEVIQLIRAAIRHLPPDEQAIITMFYYDEMSIKDIAYVTDSIPTTIASRLSRIRKKLCKIINTLRT